MTLFYYILGHLYHLLSQFFYVKVISKYVYGCKRNMRNNDKLMEKFEIKIIHNC